MPVDKSAQRVRRMFGEIAGRYDLLNHLLSLGIDRRWRRRTDAAGPARGRRARSWTSAPARAIWRWPTGGRAAAGAGRGGRFLPADAGNRAREGAPDRGRTAGVALVEADAERLPFADGQFQIVSVAFGLRNVERHGPGAAGDGPRLPAGRAGGRARILDAPRCGLSGRSTAWYFRRVLPRVGQALAKNRHSAYNYLPGQRGRVSRRRGPGRADATTPD